MSRKNPIEGEYRGDRQRDGESASRWTDRFRTGTALSGIGTGTVAATELGAGARPEVIGLTFAAGVAITGIGAVAGKFSRNEAEDLKEADKQS